MADQEELKTTPAHNQTSQSGPSVLELSEGVQYSTILIEYLLGELRSHTQILADTKLALELIRHRSDKSDIETSQLLLDVRTLKEGAVYSSQKLLDYESDLKVFETRHDTNIKELEVRIQRELDNLSEVLESFREDVSEIQHNTNIKSSRYTSNATIIAALVTALIATLGGTTYLVVDKVIIPTYLTPSHSQPTHKPVN